MCRRRAYPALFAVVLLVVGQLVALAHNAESRHVTCAEHGEELEAAQLVDELHACDHDHLIGVEGDAGDHHDECAMARALHQSTQTSRFVSPPPLIAIVTRPAALVERSAEATTALYRIAPKTSPPALI
ncbi:MAG TPA: hypothetical protein VIV11_02580 [Kofleriaceae bacterium]